MKNKAIILKADYGFNLAHNQSDEECVLSIEIYIFSNDMFATLYFKQNKISSLFHELHNDYRSDSLTNLIHQFVEILPGNNKLAIPKGIRADYRKPNHPFVFCDNYSFWEE